MIGLPCYDISINPNYIQILGKADSAKSNIQISA